jgi:hypothetical protein
MLHLSTACSWNNLSNLKELLRQILDFLPNPDKMQAAAVCQHWQQVADAACVDIQLQSVSDTQWQQLKQWLPKRGLGVSSLFLQLQPRHNICQLQLPAELCSLHLQDGRCRAPWQSWLPQQAPACLTRLVMQHQRWDCTAPQHLSRGLCLGQQQLLQEIVSFSSLQELRLDFSWFGYSSRSAGHLRVLEAVSGLQHLTCMELQGMRKSQNQQGGQQHCLAQLTKLQQLDLEVPDMQCLGGIDRLTGLTGLSLSALGSVDLSSSTDISNDIGSLASLRSLKLTRCALSASAVLTALTSLQVSCSSYAAALQLLWQLPLLASLTIRSSGNYLATTAAIAYAAITHSCHLQELDLSNAHLPDAAWQHVFPAGRHLPHLHSLWLPTRDVFGRGPLTAGEVQALADCCPVLEHLDGGEKLPMEPVFSSLTRLTQLHAQQASGTAHAAALGSLSRLQHLQLTPCKGSRGSFRKLMQWDVQPLVQLPSLTRLEVGGPLSDPAAGVLSTLVGLAHLTVGSLNEQQLQKLTALTALTRFSCDTTGFGVLLIDRLRYMQAEVHDAGTSYVRHNCVVIRKQVWLLHIRLEAGPRVGSPSCSFQYSLSAQHARPRASC